MQPPNFEHELEAARSFLAAQLSSQPEAFSVIQGALVRLGRRIALLEHSTPVNFDEQVERFKKEGPEGESGAFSFRYVPLRFDVESVRTELRSIRVALGSFRDSRWASVARLLDERAHELDLEVRLLQARKSSNFASLRRERFPTGGFEEAATQLAHDFLAETGHDLVCGEEQLLVSYLNRRVIQEGLSFSVRERPLAAAAAATEDGLIVNSGKRACLDEAERIWIHEVYAHFIPRRNSKGAPAPFWCGTAQANEDEEGRALLLEKRHACMSLSRRRELAVRHLMAEAVIEGPRAARTRAAQLVRRDISWGSVVHAWARAARGGGLAREAVYLPRYLACVAAFEKNPQHEVWMTLGRVALHACPVFDQLQTENSTTHGA